MDLLLFCLGAIITSFLMELTNELRMFKDVADAGYKVNLNKMTELSKMQKEINPNAINNKYLALLIPIFNIMQAFKNAIQYNDVRPMILDSLNVTGVLEEMSEFEKQEYSKKPIK